MTQPTKKQFVDVLQSMKRPGRKQLLFLQAHYRASGRAMTATRLGKAAGYMNYRGVNLWYGKLADRVGTQLGHTGAGLNLLVEFAPPKSITNKEWVLIMRPALADALKQAGWVR